MDTRDVANHLTNVIRETCPGIQHDYSLSYLEYTLTRELDTIIEEVGVSNDNGQKDLFMPCCDDG